MKKITTLFVLVLFVSFTAIAQVKTGTVETAIEAADAVKGKKPKKKVKDAAAAETKEVLAPAQNVVAPAQKADGALAAPAVEEALPDSKMVFESLKVDYGTQVQNADPIRKFPFTNEGTEPLVIQGAKGSCGCTVPRYPREPILPGESAEIEVRYDTKRIGPFTKTVRLNYNGSKEPIVLTITGKITQPPAGLPTKDKGLVAPN